MSVRRAICIAVDGLRASALGAYGNTWHETPAFDELASQSLLIEWMWCDSPGADGFYRAAWHGRQVGDVGAVAAGMMPNAGQSLPQSLAAAGVYTALTTDDPQIAQEAERQGFAEVRQIEVIADALAPSIADTAMAQLTAIAVDQFGSWGAPTLGVGGSPPPTLLWLHARSFHGPWDAPLELRQQLLDADDPPAPDFVTPPTMVAADDHDAALLYRAAYGAQVAALDACLGVLLAAVDELGLADETLIVLVGCRGYPLGEHGVIGGDCRNLYSELLHIPCLVRRPGASAPPPRSARLAQPVELYAMLHDWFAAGKAGVQSTTPHWMLAGDSPSSSAQQVAMALGGDGERAIRTPVWMLRRKPDADRSEPRVELYAKPDDRWESNEVADRCQDVAERLLSALDHLTAAGAATTATRLDADLVGPPR